MTNATWPSVGASVNHSNGVPHGYWYKSDLGVVNSAPTASISLGTVVALRDTLSINQSINQSNFYSTNITGEARLSCTTAKSVFNRKKKWGNSSITSTGHGEWQYLWGKAKSKRCVLVGVLAKRLWNEVLKIFFSLSESKNILHNFVIEL